MDTISIWIEVGGPPATASLHGVIET